MTERELPEVKATRQLHDVAMATGMDHQTIMGIAGIFKRLNDAEAERDAAIAVIDQIDHWFNSLGDRPVSDGETLAVMLEDAFQPVALARIKADAWDEGFTTSDESSPYRDNPYRTEAP